MRLTVVGTFTDNSDFIGDYAASDANAEAFGEPNSATNVFINLEPGADVAAVRSAIEAALDERFPTVQVQNQEELKDSIAEQLDQLLGIIYVLLLLSVVVSLFGIVNTLALTIHERTRELGLLRAVGTSRRQIRRTVRYEAVITALIGGVLGLAPGRPLRGARQPSARRRGLHALDPDRPADRAAGAGRDRRRPRRDRPGPPRLTPRRARGAGVRIGFEP